MATLSVEHKQNKLDELYEYGKSKGSLTYKEIMDRLMEMEMDPDQLDKVLDTLDAYGVSVTNDAEPQDSSQDDAMRSRMSSLPKLSIYPCPKGSALTILFGCISKRSGKSRC